MKILHISDLHYNVDMTNSYVIDAFFKDIKDTKVDFVFFSGDLTYSGTKNEFIKFKNDFYTKLKKIFSEDRIIFCPGNHDVDRYLIKKMIGKTISEQINSKEDLTQVINEHKTHCFYTTKRLQNYFDFIKTISSSYKSVQNITHTDYYTSYEYLLGGKKVGITSFNSAWLAEGGRKDYGQLAIGKQKILDAYKIIEDCDMKMCLFHHSQDWFAPFDESIGEIKKLYNFAFTGHNHSANPEIHKTPYNNLIISNTGCIYESEEYFNGYTILEIKDDNLEFNFRTYYPQRRVFDIAVNLFENGQWSIKKEQLPILNQEQQYFLRYKENAKKTLITSDNDELDFIDNFVFPCLSIEPFAQQKRITAKKTPNSIKEDDLINKSKRLIIKGKQESGKTCLLYYIGTEIYKKEKKIPLFIDFNSINTQGNKPFLRELKHLMLEDEISNIDTRLSNGECVVLIDNFDETNTKRVSVFQDFLHEYTDVSYVIAINYTVYETFNAIKRNEILDEFETIYINSFEARNIRKLVQIKNPQMPDEEIDKIVNNLCQSLSKTGLPFNPNIITIILDIHFQVGNFVPINRASLFDKLIDILLHKHSISNIARGSFDYENQIDLLAYLANLLYLKNGSISLIKFEEHTNSYLQTYGFEDITSFTLLDLFVKCNILVQYNGNVQFKVKSFQHFFFAKYISNYPEDYGLIKENYNYARMIESIDFLTGLDRKNTDLLNFLMGELSSQSSELPFEYSITNFDDSKIANGLLSELMQDIDLEKLSENNVSQKQRDEFTQIRYPENIENDSTNHFEIEDDPKLRLIRTLELSSIVVRNCELIKDIRIRENAVVKVINLWSSLLVELISTLNDDEDFLKEMKIEDEAEFKKLLNVVIPIAFHTHIIELIGNSKLKKVIFNVITEKTITKIEKLLLILIHDEIDETSNLSLLENFLNENKSFYIREVIFTYLMYLSELRAVSSSKRNKCVKLMSEIIAKRDGGGNKRLEEHLKSEFVRKTKQKTPST